MNSSISINFEVNIYVRKKLFQAPMGVCVRERGMERERKGEREKRETEDEKYLKILKVFNIFFENSKSPSSLSFLKCCIFISVVIFLAPL